MSQLYLTLVLALLPAPAPAAVALRSLTLEPASVTGGLPATGIIGLVAAAPSEGAVISLASENPADAAVPASVTVAPGALSATFPITTTPVVASSPVVITAGIGASTQTALLVVLPARWPSATIPPLDVLAGSRATGTVTLSGPAPPGGATVGLQSAEPDLVIIPAAVTVPAGATTAPFGVATARSPVLAPVVVAATYQGIVQTSTVTLLPVDEAGRPLVTRLSETSDPDPQIRINRSGQVIWRGSAGGSQRIYRWDGASVQLLPQAGVMEEALQISDGGQVLWHGDNQLYLWEHGAVRQLSRYPDGAFFERMNDVGQVVWQEYDPRSRGLFLWDGAQVRQLAPLAIDQAQPQINHAGQVVWRSAPDGRPRIFLWDGHAVRQLSSDDASAGDPQINDAGQVVWFQSTIHGMSAIYRGNGSAVEKVIDTPDAPALQLNRLGQIVWESGGNWPGGFGIAPAVLLFWDDGMLRQVAPGGGYGVDWRLTDAGQIVWQGWNGGVSLNRWDGGTTWQLPSEARYADRDDWDLNDRDQVVWREPVTGRLLLWEEGPPRVLARSGASSVRINAGGQVVWREWNGVAGEIFLSVPLDSAPPGV